MARPFGRRVLLSAAAALALAGCGGGTTIGGGAGGAPIGGGTATGGASAASPATSSPSSGGNPATATPGAGGSSPSPSTAYTAPPGLDSDAPKLATTSSQTWGLTCSPSYVISAGGISSCNMKWIAHLPMPPTSIGGRYVPSLHSLFVTGYEHGVYSFDVSDPLNVKQTGLIDLGINDPEAGILISQVQNEDPPVSATNNFLLLSNNEYQTMTVIDVHDPSNMNVLATVFDAEGHMIECVTAGSNDCAYAYTSYQPGSLAGHIVDLQKPSAPVLVGSWSPVINSVYAHALKEIHPGLMSAASDPVDFIDTTNPATPKLLFSLPQSAVESTPIGVGPPQSGHIGHSDRWPRLGQDQFFMGQDEGIYNGRCEDYPDDGRTLYSYDTTGWQTTHKFDLVGSYTLVMGNADLGLAGGAEEIDSNGQPSTVAVGFLGCATHWFDPHPNFYNGGLVAQSAFSFGVRVLNVAPSGQIQQVAWFVPSGTGGGDTVDARWISDRFLALVDFDNGGLDIVEYTGPLPASGPLTGLQLSAASQAAAPAKVKR